VVSDLVGNGRKEERLERTGRSRTKEVEGGSATRTQEPATAMGVHLRGGKDQRELSEKWEKSRTQTHGCVWSWKGERDEEEGDAVSKQGTRWRGGESVRTSSTTYWAF
jgi:hypothetical protein